MGPNRNEWQKRCTFNGFCKKVLKNEAIDAIRENRTRSRREVTFSDLPPQEENQLYTCDQYFVNDERGLLPFPVILAATKGDPDAMKIVLQHYASCLKIWKCRISVSMIYGIRQLRICTN